MLAAAYWFYEAAPSSTDLWVMRAGWALVLAIALCIALVALIALVVHWRGWTPQQRWQLAALALFL